MHAHIENLLQSAQQPFNIIEELSALSPKRKFLLCDHLFGVSRSTFLNTVKLFWPEAEPKDVRKLEKFLSLLQKSSISH